MCTLFTKFSSHLKALQINTYVKGKCNTLSVPIIYLDLFFFFEKVKGLRRRLGVHKGMKLNGIE